MKELFYLLLTVFCIQFSYSQNSYNSQSFTKITLESNVDFKVRTDNLKSTLKNHKSIVFSELNMPELQFDAKGLDTTLFSNFEIIENNHIDYSEYLRGCGSLKDGITNHANSGDLILSLVIDNIVNNVIFKKGIFFRN